MNADANMPTWAVALTVSEPKELVLANVAHHLSMGASKVFVFLDTPDPVLEAILAPQEKCHVTNCDADYWQKNHGRKKAPLRIIVRQIFNCDSAIKMTQTDWLLSLDADEFLWCDTDFRAVLADVPTKAGWLKLLPWERRLDHCIPQDTIFDGSFIGISEDKDAKEFSESKFTGHVVGKPCVRMGAGYRITVHNPRIGPIRDKKIPPAAKDKRAILLHFDGLTPFHWGYKLLFRAARGPDYIKANNFGKRRNQIGSAAKIAHDEDALARMLSTLGEVSLENARARRENGLLRDIDLQVAQSCLKYFPNEEIDFSPEKFDANIAPLFDKVRRKVLKMGDVWDFTKTIYK